MGDVPHTHSVLEFPGQHPIGGFPVRRVDLLDFRLLRTVTDGPVGDRGGVTRDRLEGEKPVNALEFLRRFKESDGKVDLGKNEIGRAHV